MHGDAGDDACMVMHGDAGDDDDACMVMMHA